MESLGKLTEAERGRELKGQEGRCVCPDCRTYTDCARSKSEFLFCLEGKSPDCITKGVECICPTCPVEVEYDMKNMYYCIEGSEADKRKRKAERIRARKT